jgi:hypothetical protein
MEPLERLIGDENETLRILDGARGIQSPDMNWNQNRGQRDCKRED